MSEKSRKKPGITYGKLREEALSIKSYLATNLIITSVSLVLLFASLIFFGEFLFKELFTYAYDNINVSQISIEDLSSGVDIGTISFGSSVLEQFLQQLFVVLILLVLPDALWIGTFIARIARFAYLLILSVIIIYFVIFFLISLVISKSRFTITVVSLIFSTAISFAITFFFIPNNDQLIVYLGTKIKELVNSKELFLDLFSFSIDILYSFYQGFFIAFIVHLITSTVLQYSLRNY